MRLYATAIAFAAAAAVATPALGATYTFAGPWQRSPSFTFGDLTVTATENGARANVVRSRAGLGVTDRQIDDNTPRRRERREVMRFDFGQRTALQSITFSNAAGRRDSISLSVDGVAIDLISLFGSDRIQTIGSGAGSVFTVLFSGLIPNGSVFAITDGAGQRGGDDFSIKGLTAVSAVPLPASLFLFLGALGLTGVIARRRA